MRSKQKASRGSVLATHLDLRIIDKAHRSAYLKYEAIFENMTAFF